MSYTNFAATRLKQKIIYLVPLLLVFPSLIWIKLDQRVWPWDQAWYGEVSTNLFYTLYHNPDQWLTAMQQAIGQKPPGITWLGQFFVPIGYLLGSIEVGLLLSVVFVQALTLGLIYWAVYQLSERQWWIALTGSVVVAAAPLFVSMSHQYFAEPLQTLTVVWFILIMTFAPKWNRLFLISQLLAASALAMLAKMTSPLLCLGPGLVGIWYLFRPVNNHPFTYGWRNTSTLASLAISLLLSVAAAGWFAQNYTFALWHVLINSSGPIAEAYGKKDTFLNSLDYWLYAVQTSFFHPIILGLSAFIVIGGVVGYIKRHPLKFDYFALSVVIASLQIGVILTVYSFGVVRDHRYLLAMLPYVAILICWGLRQINKPFLTGLVMVAFLGQWLLVYSQALAIISPQANLSYWLYPLNPDVYPVKTLQAIINQTCTEADQGRYNIIGVETPSLNANSAQFFAAKNRLKSHVYCYYTSFGYAESDPERAWARRVDLNVRYLIFADPAIYPIPPDALNQSLNAINEAILAKARTSPLMQPLPPLPDASGVFIFRSVEE